MRDALIVLVTVLALSALTVGAVSTYSTGEVLRGGAADVSADANAVIQLQQPLDDGPSDGGELTTITNNFDTAKQYTVTLQNRQPSYDIRLANGQSGTGDSITFTLGAGETATIEYVKTDTSAGGGEVEYRVDAKGAVSATLTRLRPIAAADPISVDEVSGVSADVRQGGFIEIDTVRVSDSDGDIQRIEYEVRDASTGDVVGSYTNTSVSGSTVEISEAFSADLNRGQEYDIVVTAFDSDGDSAQNVTRVTAGSGTGQPPCSSPPRPPSCTN